ncbi:MAG TPA: MFS transporter, partial [Nevskiaceae bacterium]
MPRAEGSERPRGWRAAWSVYAHPRVAGMFFLGFSSGLPFLLVFSTMSAWLALDGVNVKSIGYFSLVGLAYSLKFFWAPIIDRLPLPLVTHLLGRRRSWLLLAQLGVTAGLAAIASSNPGADLGHVAWLATGVAFASATQDICIDAWRIEAVGPELQGAMAAVYQFGYRLAMLFAGAGALVVAAKAGWYWAYMSMAILMAVGIVTTLLVPEPDTSTTRAVWQDEERVRAFLKRSSHRSPVLRDLTAWLIGAVVCPFTDFFRRNPWRLAMLILAFICVYRLSYFTKGVMANPFYLDLGFTLDQIAAISKVFGVIMTMVGAAVGGWMVARYGLLKTLLVGLVLIAAAGLY